MTFKRLLVLTGAMLGCALLLGTPILGYNTFAKWGTLTVPIYVNPANRDVSLSAAIAGVQAAMNVWNTQSGTPFRYTYAGQVSQTTTGNDRKNVVLFRNATNGGAIATTYSWWTVNGTLLDSDVIFWDGHTRFFTGSSGCVSGAYIEDVGAHELGHALGLSHSSVSGATMNASYGTCSKNQRTLASDDIAGAKRLYGSSGSGSTTTPNSAPSVTISGPANGLSQTAGVVVTFSGSASDPEQGNLTGSLIWRSNLMGQIGTGGSFTKTLLAGTHTITASVTDSGGLTTQRQITVYSTSASVTAGTLTATKRINSDGLPYTKLVWKGISSTNVDVHRNGAIRATTNNDGDYADRVGAGTYTYKVCKAGTSTCTNQVSVTY